jgi:hypothetical protein
MIKLSRNLTWFRPFLNEVIETDEFDLTTLESIKGIRATSTKKLQDAEGLAWFIDDIPRSIEVYLTYQERYDPFDGDKCRLKRMPFSKIDILAILAHEMAHVCDTFDHTPSHKITECLIMQIFMSRLERIGYVSEEFEFSKIKKKRKRSR